MGRINNSVEIIPIDGPSGLHSRQIIEDAREQNQQRVNMSYMSDPFIVQRVRQYLEANVDKTYVDIAEMADFLQTKYKEYNKRKRSAFRGLVKRAYSIVVKSYDGSDALPSSSESEPEDCEDVDDEPDNNTMNDQLLDMYNRSQKKPLPDELIDISSDDSSDLPDTKPVNSNNNNNNNKLNTNGPPPPPLSNNSNNSNNLFQERPVIIRGPLLPTPNITSILPVPTPTLDRGKKRKLELATGSIGNKRKKEIPLQEPATTFKDVGGMDDVLKEVCKLLVHIRHPEIYKQIGISPPRGFLLHGPPGCGKTLLASAIAGELKIPLLKVAAPELVAGVSGESEERIRDLFEKAIDSAPCILFIDEVDAITPNRQQASKEMERRIVAQLLSCLDELGNNDNGDRVLVIGATNRPDSLDPALRRAGRFDREVCLGIPNVEARVQILKVLCSKLKLTSDFDYLHVAKNAPGFVGADLMSLTREAAMAAINRVFVNLKTTQTTTIDTSTTPAVEAEFEGEEKPNSETIDVTSINVDNTDNNTAAEPVDSQQAIIDVEKTDDEKKEVVANPFSVDVKKTSLEELISWLHGQAPLTDDQLSELCIQMDDFEKALKCVQPSSKREGFATVPDVTWDDVGSLQDIREELQMSILAPVRYSKEFESLGITNPTGVLLCGPPGCGKTLLAKAIANEAGINFISVKGPELLNMYVGESERAVRQCFQRARNSVPCVIFFDELDALCPKRSDSGEGGASMRVVNQMLTEMDGIEGRHGVFLMAASNRPDIVDPAVLRPGRLDKILYVGLPSAEDRVDILRAITKKGTRPLLATDVDLELIGKFEQCEGYTGADLAALVREASIEALKELMVTGNIVQTIVTNEHFKKAILRIRPSVSERDQKHYEKLRKLYSKINAPPPPDEEVMECS